MSDLDKDFVGTKLGRHIEGGLSDFAIHAAVDGVLDRRHFAFGGNGPYTWALGSSLLRRCCLFFLSEGPGSSYTIT